MNYETEPWYKLYIRESTEDKLLPVLNRGLRDFLLRLAKSRKDGTILARTENPGEDLARALGAHPDEFATIVAFVRSMLEDGYLRHRKGRLWITNFVDAQEARSAGARRQKRYRDKDKESRASDDDEHNEGITSDVTRDARVTSQERRSEKRREETRREDPKRAGARPGWLERAKELERKPGEEPQPRRDELGERISLKAWAISQQVLDWAKERQLPDAKLDAALIELGDKCQGLHDVSWWDLKAIAFVRNAIAWHHEPKQTGTIGKSFGPAAEASEDVGLLTRARRGEYGRQAQELASGPAPIVADIRQLVRQNAAGAKIKPPDRESA